MNDKTTLDLANAAYHAYAAVTDWKNYQGLPMPKFEDLPPTIKQAWCAVAEFFVTIKNILPDPVVTP